MSKAFVKDDAPVEELVIPRRDLTDGQENHMTTEGFEAFKAEYALLSADKQADPLRLQVVKAALESAHVIDPAQQKGDRVLFGATVTVTDENGDERVYRIVGVDETDATAGKVSWMSPIGKALLQARVGDAVVLKTPQKSEELEIEKIEFIPIPAGRTKA